MALSSPLITLIDLAEKATDAAAAKLGKAIRAQDELEQKLALLKTYREDYAAKLLAGLKSGRDIQHIRNFQVFLGKIDEAIAGQQQLVLHAQMQVQLEQLNWQDQERKRMSYMTLEERAVKVKEKKEAKREQNQNDEFGARLAYTVRQS